MASAKRVSELIEKINSFPLEETNIDEFALYCLDVLSTSDVCLRSLIYYIESQWDVKHPGALWVDSEEPPYLIDVYTCDDWVLRLTVWINKCGLEQSRPHSHYGYIIIKAMTDPSYFHVLYGKDIYKKKYSVQQQKLMCFPDVQLITPETFHKVDPLKDELGVTLSIRTKAVKNNIFTLNDIGEPVMLENETFMLKEKIISILRSKCEI